MSTTSLCLRAHKHSFGTAKANVQIICKDDAGPDHTFEADGYILRAVSTRFEKLLDGIDLSKHNAKMNKTGDSDAQSTSSHSTSMTPAQITPYPLVLKDSAQRVLLLLQFLNYAPLLPYLPANRTFSARELLTLLELADAYKLKDAPRATLRAYIARSAPALAMHVTEYADLKVLVSLVEASGCAVLARALFRLDWDAEKVLLLHLHHLAQPWDMPDDVIRDLPADIYAAFVYVETERAMAGGRLQDMSVSYSRSGQFVFTFGGERVAFGDEVVAGRFFRR